METLQSLLDSSTMPILTAFLLGLLTAINPCPLATNIAAIGYISKNMENRNRIFINGLLYTLGRIIAYTGLAFILILILRDGTSAFPIQKFFARWGGRILGPALMLVGLFLLFGERLNLPKFGFGGNGEKYKKYGGFGALLLGILFALAFCPASAVLYFGMLIPLSVTADGGIFLPVVFAIATSLPVIAAAWFLAYSASAIGGFYGKMQTIQKWMNRIVGILFLAIGGYYCLIFLF
ncbi:MAG: aromatic aminobenezylarsenical efflux permease ArsG family transporter [Paludibacteraceae bacterium]|nr:sulfite exporter TauE/SafE family protein [Prevotellaceae bacterium]